MKTGHRVGSASRVSIVVLLVALAVFASSSGRASTVAYWVYGDSGTLTDLVGDDQTLTNGSNVVDSPTTVAHNPVRNPDPATNGAAGSISFGATSIAPKTTSAGPFKLTSASSWTLEGWLQTSATTGVIAGDRHKSSVPQYHGWYLLVNAEGKLRFYFTTGTAALIDGSTVVNDNNPHHFAAVWDHADGKMRLYVDGNLEGEASPAVGSYTSAAGFGIGARENGGDKIFNDDRFIGLLDELRFSDVALTPSEFMWVWWPTVAYWQFDNNNSATPSEALTDSVGSYDLSVVAGSFVASTDAAANPVPIPDTTPVFAGDPAANPDGGTLVRASLIAPGGASWHYLRVPSDPGNVFNLSGKSFTFEGWFRHKTTSNPSAFGDIIGGSRNTGGYDGWLLMMKEGGDIRAFFSEDTNWLIETSGTDYRSATEFHHFALVWEDGAGTNSTGFASIYIDGVLEASGSAPAGWSAADADAGDEPFIIGGRGVSSDNTWDGSFDEFRFSEIALTPSEFLNYTPAGTVISIR